MSQRNSESKSESIVAICDADSLLKRFDLETIAIQTVHKNIPTQELLLRWLTTPSSCYPLLPSLGSYAMVQPRINPESPLERFMKILETPFLDQEMEGWSLPQQDLIPTSDDFILCFMFLEKDSKRAGPILHIIDKKDFLERFFQQPAPLRLVICAMAAHFASPALPEEISNAFYRRARKAVFRATDTPCISTAQAICLIFVFTRWKGQPMIGWPFLKAAIGMSLDLRLDIDPDDSPWLGAISENKKEERRRLFWACLYILKSEQSLVDDDDLSALELHINRVKPPAPLEGHYQPFDCFHSLCDSYNKIIKIKRDFRTAPESVKQLLTSPTTHQRYQNLIGLHQTIPKRFLLIAESSQALEFTDLSRFSQQLSTLSSYETPFLICMNLNLLAAISMIHRPKLFLSSLPSCHPTKISVEAKSQIEKSINQAFDSACRIACLTSLLVNATGNTTNAVGKEKYFKAHTSVCYPLFESMCVFWFIICRMEREWHPFLRYGYTAMSTLFSLWKARFVQMMEYLKQNQVGNGGMVEPLVQCVEAMYAEMEAVMNGECIHLAELELRMRVFSIGNGNEEENVKVGQVLITRQPWAFLGLLGLSVAGAVRCRGKSEDDWREFWNRNRFEVRGV